MRNWGILSRYRSELMGAAALWIVLLHSTIWFSWFPAAYIKAIGYCGVDCFLFLSAVGLFFSWKKSGSDIGSFYRRRFLRIIPAYLIVVVVRCFMEQTGKRYAVLLAATLSFWLRNDLSMWFIAGIVVLYLLSPLFLRAMDSPQRSLWFGLFFAAAFLMGWLMRRTPQNVFFVRVPSFLLGFSCAERIYEKRNVTNTEGILMSAGFLVGTALMVICQKGLVSQYETIDWMIRWYSVLLFELPLLFLTAGGIHSLNESGITLPGQLLSGLGKISLELYLIFEVLLRFFRETPLAHLPFEYHGWAYTLIIFAMTVLASYGVHWLAGEAARRLEPSVK